jgi:hypothetical protein
LLAGDEVVGEPLTVEAIAYLLHCNKDTVCEARKRLVERGFSAALERKKRENPAIPRLFDSEAEAKLIALACSTPPEELSLKRRL